MTCQAAEGMLAPSNWKNFGTRTTTSAASVSTSSTTSDRKSTRLNSSHSQISYAVFCLKKKKLPDLSPNLHKHPASPITHVHDTILPTIDAHLPLLSALLLPHQRSTLSIQTRSSYRSTL